MLGVMPVILGLASCRSEDSSTAEETDAAAVESGDENKVNDGQVTPGEGGDGESGTPGEGGPTCSPATQPATAECAACVQSLSQSSCQTETKACDASADCVAIRTCAVACASFQCLYECIDKNKAGESTFIAWRGCVDTGCHDACHCTECRLFLSSPCHECAILRCNPQCLGCDKSSACMAAMYCRYFHCTEPDSPACWDECTKAYPGSETAFLGLLGTEGCIPTQCGVECSKQ